MRMAGDEFMVFVETGLQEEAEKCQARIEKRVQHFNDTTDLPFYLSFSYGVAKYDGQELRDFLAEMDEKMYNEKKVNLGWSSPFFMFRGVWYNSDYGKN